MTAGAAAGAAAAAAALNALKASGVVVRVEPAEFRTVLARARGAAVVLAPGGWFGARYQYLLSYKGFAFFTKSDEVISIPQDVEQINARSIYVPG